jgi:hypothetical protein
MYNFRKEGMGMRYARIALFVFAALPCLAQDEAWRHSFGLRAGIVGVFPTSYSLSAFHEAQSNQNMAIRSALEFTIGSEWAIYGGDMGYMTDVRRVGAAVDFIYYTSPKRPIGTGLFVMAGIGAHRFYMEDIENIEDRDPLFPYEPVPKDLQDRRTAASFALGIGFTGKKFGFELKGYMSNQDSQVAKGIGRNWIQTGMLFRFPMLGQQKNESVREANYRAKKNAEKIAKEIEAQESVPQHKIGLRLGSVGFSGGGGSIFYEHQFDKHWAIRPAIELTKGSEEYDDIPYGSRRTVDVDRVGLAVDCIYYMSRRWKDGTRFYLLAGLGTHKVNMKQEEFLICGKGIRYTEYPSSAPALSAGLGHCFSRFFGMEYKHTFSALNSPFYDETVGKYWGQFTLNFRIPLVGATK